MIAQGNKGLIGVEKRFHKIQIKPLVFLLSAIANCTYQWMLLSVASLAYIYIFLLLVLLHITRSTIFFLFQHRHTHHCSSFLAMRMRDGYLFNCNTFHTLSVHPLFSLDLGKVLRVNKSSNKQCSSAATETREIYRFSEKASKGEKSRNRAPQ